MRTAEELCIRKPMRPEYGGGTKEFVYDDLEFFVDADDESSFFTSQERQSIVRHMLFNLRAHDGEVLGNIKFNKGQAIGKVARSL